MRRLLGAGVLVLAFTGLAAADGPGDNLPDKVRPVPPAGIAVPEKDREALEGAIRKLGENLDAFRTEFKNRPGMLELLPDVEIFHNAARYALRHNEFHAPREIQTALDQLRQGEERLAQLKARKTPWTTAKGLVVRGYRSRIDGSVQPYGLLVPETFQPDGPHRYRLDVWLHGRGEKLSEVNFLAERETSHGQFTPPNAFVLHPYGRYCNAFKFAGEIDVLEALEHVKKHYPIDNDRLVMRGFSMGGAGCWQFAVHYPSMWAAAAPGAGFSETPDFLKVFQNENLKPTDYEKKLWHLYDCTDYAQNLYHVPTVAYSGEKDKQKQAADVMAKAMQDYGLNLLHIIGPDTAHAYHPLAKAEINKRIDAIAARGRDPLPRTISFVTWTLRYNECHWVRVDGLEKHWQRARVYATVLNERPMKMKVSTENVTALTIDMGPGLCPFDPSDPPFIAINNEPAFAGPPVMSDRSWRVHLRRDDKGVWWPVEKPETKDLQKRPGLQGPIDDAFMDSFLMVRPTGKAMNDKVGAWCKAEMEHALDHWRKQFRGEARVKDDSAVSEADVAAHNLVLWGDPTSNAVLAKIADKLPVKWTAEGVKVGEQTYPAGSHVPVLIYPNPLNPKRYVVLNSGFTFREYDYLNNARQVPKLPDWAVIDVEKPRTSRAPGGIAAADFFDERWQLGAK